MCSICWILTEFDSKWNIFGLIAGVINIFNWLCAPNPSIYEVCFLVLVFWAFHLEKTHWWDHYWDTLEQDKSELSGMYQAVDCLHFKSRVPLSHFLDKIPKAEYQIAEEIVISLLVYLAYLQRRQYEVTLAFYLLLKSTSNCLELVMNSIHKQSPPSMSPWENSHWCYWSACKYAGTMNIQIEHQRIQSWEMNNHNLMNSFSFHSSVHVPKQISRLSNGAYGYILCKDTFALLSMVF